MLVVFEPSKWEGQLTESRCVLSALPHSAPSYVVRLYQVLRCGMCPPAPWVTWACSKTGNHRTLRTATIAFLENKDFLSATVFKFV